MLGAIRAPNKGMPGTGLGRGLCQLCPFLKHTGDWLFAGCHLEADWFRPKPINFNAACAQT
jgi:hypothetical protein